MNEKKVVENFKSYINVNDKNNEDRNGSRPEVEPKLLNGELVVGVAHDVAMLTPFSERDKRASVVDRDRTALSTDSEWRMGSIFVTNYKLSFVPIDNSHNHEYSQRNYLLGSYDVPLTGVGAVWLTDGGPVRRRRLIPYGDVPAKVKGLQVVCKNMRVFTFSFANSSIGNGRKVGMALMHHAFPKRHDLLFAFEYKEVYYPTIPPDLNMFQRTQEWKRELERCNCPHWRITTINGTVDAFMLTAVETLIVPNSVLDCHLMKSARYFRSGRVPVWVWGRPEGGALLRSGELLPTDQSLTAESVLLEQVRKSHPKLTPPHVVYLCGNQVAGGAGGGGGGGAGGGGAPLPPLAHLHSSYKKLLELCTPTTLSGFWVQDSQYYSILESSRWLRHVASCIWFAEDAASHLQDNITVVLQEGDGVDYCAVVSSLTQLLMDPHFRTISGFQSLIQKEWISLGHPFCDRLGLPRPGLQVSKDSKESKEPSVALVAPVFLLFLDCTWQLLQQFPAHFQFTETYLTTLWDCLHNHLFDTFIFNCPRERDLATSKNFISRPVWDWSEQFSERDKALFYNPLYVVDRLNVVTPNRRLSYTPSATSPRLSPSTGVQSMELWSQCYERWLTPLDASLAGPVQYYLYNCRALRQVQELNERLASLSILGNRQSNGDRDKDKVEGQVRTVSRFHPFSFSRSDPVRDLDSMQVSLIDASDLLDSQSLLNAPD